MIEADGVRLRRATRDDVEFLLALVNDEDVRPFLAVSARLDEEELHADLDRQEREPDAFGRFVIEVAEDAGWRRAGTLGFHRVSERNRIAHLERIAVHPDFRGRRLADEAARLVQRHLVFDLGYHRLEMKIYGYNERAQRHAERAGWIREGVQRKAYRPRGDWVDAVLYGLLREDLE